MLQERHGWIPQRHTKTGAPQVDDDVLRALPYPEAPKLADYFFVTKMKGNLETWLKNAVEVAPGEFRLFPTMNTNGAVTGRCTHRLVVNVPAAKKKPGQPDEKIEYGRRSRSCFIAAPGKMLCGFDASNLELVMLAHYVWKWDDGEYARILTEGDKAKGTDPHSWARDLIGTELIGEGSVGRENAKTFKYMYIYGGGAEKAGHIVSPKATKKEKVALGTKIKARFVSRFEALGELQQAIEGAVESRGFLIGLDGRKLRVRKAHAAVNTLLQAAGAVVMKKALVCLDEDLRALGWRRGHDYGFVLNVHDEVQAEVRPELVELYEQRALLAVPKAALDLGVKCPLKAEAGHGLNWSATH